MKRVFIWSLRTLIACLVLVGGAGVFAYWVLSRSLPDYDRVIPVNGLEREIEIIRNTANVPHIFGATDEDSLFGLGYAHAQDRLWQMTLLRRTAQGRLSEMFGRETLETDMLLRRLDLYNLARQSFYTLNQDTQSLLRAYADGVNARLFEINRGALGRGAPEFFLFSNAIAPWQPADSIAVLKLMGLQTAAHLEDEVLRAQLSLVLDDPRRRKDVMPSVPGPGVAELPEYSTLFPDVPTPPVPRHAQHAPLSPFRGRGFASASNAWAALPSRSARGGTLLASDPHLKLSAPSVWYLARIELETGGVIGGTIPGAPLVVMGRSERLGWGLTASYVDDQDLYIERLNPDAPGQYQTPTGFTTFRRRQSIIEIAGESPVTLELLWTENGPVLPGRHFNLESITPPGHVVSLAWTLLSPSDTTIQAGFEMMRSQNVFEALKATDRFVAPSYNLVLADQSQIAMKTLGALPKRSPRHRTQGRLPSPGWVADNRWQGVFPQDMNPTFVNPTGGVLGNTNNKVIDRPFPEHVSFYWEDTQRVLRWQRLMQRRRVHTRESFMEAQLDTVSPTARTLLPLIGAELWFEAEAAEPGTRAARRQTALALLAQWNGEMNEHLPEPLIYAAWVQQLQRRLLQDELGPLAAKFTTVEPLFLERAFRNINGAAVWCDVVQSAPVETCADIALVALDEALIALEQRFGGRVEALRWGDAHLAAHKHRVLGDTPFLKWFVNIYHSTSGGDNTLMRGKTVGTGDAPYHSINAAGYRGVYDFADPDSSVFVIATGQSGHPLSRFYDDLGELWRRGEYIPMSLDKSLAQAAALGITRLVPPETQP